MSRNKKYIYEPDYAVPPGETLEEVMESLGMTQKDLALRTGLTVQTLNRIFKGEQPITYETANRLELVTGVPARFWNNLESQYREGLSKIDEKKQLAESLDWLKTIPVLELTQRGIVKSHDDKILLLREVLAFYGVSSVEAWKAVWESPEVAARRSRCFETMPGPASSWIRLGELQAYEIICKPYNKVKFLNALGKIRPLTREKCEVFEPEMKRLCAAAGVALALVPEIKKVPWNGATRWLTPQKAMILLSLRGKKEDTFWFSFFHEAGHVLHDGKKDLYINDNSDQDEREERANRFAAGFLIPPEYNDGIRVIVSKSEIIEIASELGIAPGIVAGRYQYLTKKWGYFKDLIRHLEWKK